MSDLTRDEIIEIAIQCGFAKFHTPEGTKEMHVWPDAVEKLYQLGLSHGRAEAIEAVDDAGGDNTVYHIEAIRQRAKQ